MHNNSILKAIVKFINNEMENIFMDKLINTVLFGSYARGDYDIDSDVDIMILVNIKREDVNNFITDVSKAASEASINFDVTVSCIVIPNDDFEKYKEVLPFYRNIIEEGVLFNV